VPPAGADGVYEVGDCKETVFTGGFAALAVVAALATWLGLEPHAASPMAIVAETKSTRAVAGMVAIRRRFTSQTVAHGSRERLGAVLGSSGAARTSIS
jgi:hypothetical protein